MIKNKSKIDLSSGELIVAGRCRFAGIQIADGTSGSANKASALIGSGAYDRWTIKLLNGSAAGDALFKVTFPAGTDYGMSIMPYYYGLGDARILFPDGIWVDAMPSHVSGSPDPAKTMISIFYEGA